MAYRRELGTVTESAIVAIGELIARVKELPVADHTAVRIKLYHPDTSAFSDSEVSWVDGKAVVPSLGFFGSVRPQYLLESVKIGESNWPKRAFFQRDLHGPNRTLDYSLEMLEVVKQFCIRGYVPEVNLVASFVGRSGDQDKTECFVELRVQDDVYVLTGEPPVPASKEDKFVRHGW